MALPSNQSLRLETKKEGCSKNELSPKWDHFFKVSTIWGSVHSKILSH